MEEIFLVLADPNIKGGEEGGGMILLNIHDQCSSFVPLVLGLHKSEGLCLLHCNLQHTSSV